jgi:hypothetical protein
MSYDSFVDEQQENSIVLEGQIVLVAGKTGLPYELLDFLGPLRARHLYNGEDGEESAADGARKGEKNKSGLRSIVILSEQQPSRRHFEVRTVEIQIDKLLA